MYCIQCSTPEYREGVTEFVYFADNDRKIRMSKYMLCPSADYKNEKIFDESSWVHSHLIHRGFVDHYRCWSKYGEQKTLDVATNEVPVCSEQPSRLRWYFHPFATRRRCHRFRATNSIRNVA